MSKNEQYFNCVQSLSSFHLRSTFLPRSLPFASDKKAFHYAKLSLIPYAEHSSASRSTIVDPRRLSLVDL